jgi:CDP-diacylglycerol--glycerol-3-phosphate 3-phosphatidyltransferase
MWSTLPNRLTWLRILLIPVFIAVFYVPDTLLSPFARNVVATVLFVIAALTDALDGHLARSLNQTSAFGAFLDPVADKLMVAVALVLLVEIDRVHAVVAFIIIGREITISALREWMAKVGASRSVAVSVAGKVKTVAQMVAIPMLLYGEPLLGLPVRELGTALILVAAALTVWSMVYYLKRALPLLAGPVSRPPAS